MYLNTKDMKNKKRKQRKKKVVGRNNKRTRRQRGFRCAGGSGGVATFSYLRETPGYSPDEVHSTSYNMYVSKYATYNYIFRIFELTYIDSYKNI